MVEWKREAKGMVNKSLIVVTGSSGFIGQALLHKLARNIAESKFEVVGLDIRSVPTTPAQVECFQVDLGDPKQIREFFSNLDRPLDGLINLAAYYDFNNGPSIYYDNLLNGLPALAEGFQQNRSENAVFVQASSMAALAPVEPGKRQTADSPSEDRWAYPRFKMKSEEILRKCLHPHELVEFVLAAVYSDFCELVPLYHFIENHRGYGAKRWVYPASLDRGLTYLHIDDCVEAFLTQLEQPHRAGRLLIGEPEPTTYRHISTAADQAFHGRSFPKIPAPKWTVKLGAKFLGSVSKNEFYQSWMIDMADEHYAFDLTSTRDLLGWSPSHYLQAELPNLLSNATSNSAAWHARNLQRPWHRNHWVGLLDGTASAAARGV